MGAQQVTQGVGGEQGHIAVGDDDRARQVGRQGRQPALDGPAGAFDLVLVGDEAVRVARFDVRGHPVAFVADNDLQVERVDPAGGSDRVVDQAASADHVQDLGRRRLHPGALACGEDDDRCRARVGHIERSYPPLGPRADSGRTW
jgi:hypothetical protein